MPLSRTFKITVTRRSQATPVVFTFRTREEAMRAASGYQPMLEAKAGGQIIVHDPDGKELQVWIEHPVGAHFTHHGGFQLGQ